MTTYTTETGHYVLVNSDGDVIARCEGHRVGTHRVSDDADPAQCYDVDSPSDFPEISRPGEKAPQYRDVMDKIETASRQFGEYWVYERLSGNTPDAMPAPLRDRQSVPDRDSGGTYAEQAVADWMDRYEAANSL